MVNREQDVIDRVHNERVTVSTGPLSNVFTLETFAVSILHDTDDVFTMNAVGHETTVNGNIIKPADGNQDFDLFKLQDEEPMDALETNKEPSTDWEPRPEDVMAVEADILTEPKWEDLQDGFGVAMADIESSLDDPVRMYLREIGR
jgi:RNA polymerase primary sigma factor